MIDNFLTRHLGPREKEIQKMLSFIGVESIEELLTETIPEEIRLKDKLESNTPLSEYQFLKHIQALSNKNKLYDTYIGLGYHPTITPPVIQRNILENPGWYTAYTPYQAEIAQGRLEALFNFQTMVSDLTGMELANASLLDESTAAAEAMSMLFSLRTREQKKANANKFFVSNRILPQTLEVLNTRATPLGIELVVESESNIVYNSSYFGAIFQYPGKHGKVINLSSAIRKAKSFDIKTVVAADLLSLTLLEAPGKYGVDVVVGTTQRFGIPLGYGGPHAAYYATKEQYKRSIPGRIIGQTIDLNGNPALRMALQTREQHIKRDRATSNICTAQVLLAVMAGMYGAYHGPNGLKSIAEKIHSTTKELESRLFELGFINENEYYFDTLKIQCDSKLVESASKKLNINLLIIDPKHVGISLNETSDKDSIDKLVKLFKRSKDNNSGLSLKRVILDRIPFYLKRETPYMTHKVFNSYHSETSLMRYIKTLERKDLALNHSMISLGSCTMKLNAAAEMLPLSWPQWNSIHPFAPDNQVEGYKEMLNELEIELNKVTGFHSTSLQPNSGAQGEYSGLMVIRAYHNDNNDSHRNICLIPSSAHGTNPASAVMAGMKVVVIKTDELGNIDINDLSDKAEQYKDNLAALMITYPSTHGVFESNIKTITDKIHECGGQVYMDGANMNAQVGLTSPALIGADVCHLNLHKTFAIPHGGGGPGVGPICVAEHLSKYLPDLKVSAAPYGSALACIISYGYIKMLGGDGLTKATEIAILNANYIKKRLEGSYDILYTGIKGRSAHELIIDCRPFRESKIEVVDIAKRLMDYGFHAPTVSFPVPGTMMIEPTESENLEEIDRFCNAMISIRGEINKGNIELLKNAPHTQAMVTSDEWTYPYTRQQAAFPLDFVSNNKLWPSVRRVDEAYGDRNLVCSCNPIEAYK